MRRQRDDDGMTRNRKLRAFLAKWLFPPFSSVALQPVARVRDKAGFERAMAADAVTAVREAESRITRAYQGSPLVVEGLCGACQKHVDLQADMLFGGRRDREGRFVTSFKDHPRRRDPHVPPARQHYGRSWGMVLTPWACPPFVLYSPRVAQFLLSIRRGSQGRFL